MLLPADVKALDHVVERARSMLRAAEPFFLFCNLFDVHAPYSPSNESMFRPVATVHDLIENALAPIALARIGRHEYLRPGFRMRDRMQEALRSRYQRAVELMDEKLERFWHEAERARILDDTCVILCSDHGEAFGEHGLYLHDASVYQTHLHVPLWVHHPDVPPHEVEDVVSLRSLFDLIRAVGLGEPLQGTLLSEGYRSERAVALAQHYHYPHVRGAHPRYRQEIMAAISRETKVVLRREGVEWYRLSDDAAERAPTIRGLADFGDVCRREGAPSGAVAAAVDALSTWGARQSVPA
jgi:arylsulfatase A-like enzyme